MGRYPVDFRRYMVEGLGHQIQTRIVLAAGETKSIVLTLDDTLDYCVYGMPIQVGSTSGLVFLDTYSADSYVKGTLMSPGTVNMNERRGNGNLANFYEGGVITGENFTRQYTIGSDSTRQSSGGGFSTNDMEKILVNQPLVFKFENREATENIITFGYVWFECPYRS